MLPIHLVIGLVEGLITAAVLLFIFQARPQLLRGYGDDAPAHLHTGAVASILGATANLKAVRRLMGYVFQDSESQLFMPTIYEDVAFGPRNYGYTKEQVDDAVRTALRQVHLEDRCHQPIYQLSGGEKKLASIATVLAMQSQLMLLDEPSVALDPRHRRELIHLLGNLDCAKLIASHDLDFIYDTCQRVVLLGEGNKVCEGPTAQVLQDQALLEQHGLELPLSFSRRIRGGTP